MFGFILLWVQTFVYGDLYRYDVEKQEWKLVSSPNSPPPRSAHQAVVWKNYLYIFGTNWLVSRIFGFCFLFWAIFLLPSNCSLMAFTDNQCRWWIYISKSREISSLQGEICILYVCRKMLICLGFRPLSWYLLSYFYSWLMKEILFSVNRIFGCWI